VKVVWVDVSSKKKKKRGERERGKERGFRLLNERRTDTLC
jgi:hypothetical protein